MKADFRTTLAARMGLYSVRATWAEFVTQVQGVFALPNLAPISHNDAVAAIHDQMQASLGEDFTPPIALGLLVPDLTQE